MWSTVVHRVADCIIRHAVPQPAEWENIGNEINAAMILARSDFVNVQNAFHNISGFMTEWISQTADPGMFSKWAQQLGARVRDRPRRSWRRHRCYVRQRSGPRLRSRQRTQRSWTFASGVTCITPKAIARSLHQLLWSRNNSAAIATRPSRKSPRACASRSHCQLNRKRGSRASCERLMCIAYPIAWSGVSYHNRPNGSASEMRSTPRWSLRGLTSDGVTAWIALESGGGRDGLLGA